MLHAPLHPTGDAAAVIAGPGNLASGHNALAQAFTQFPIPAHRGGYSTGVTDLYQVGAASWPGVGGSSGRAVARGLLNRT